MNFRRSQFNLFFVLVTFFIGWWFLSAFFLPHNEILKEWFGLSYGAIALLGGIIGLVNARSWGGWSNFIGRALMCFAVGLFLQEFGQIVYSYYIIVAKIQIPYPSIGDFGFTASIPFYIYGMYLLGQAAISYGLVKSYYQHLGKALISLALLPIFYFIFLSDNTLNSALTLEAFLNLIVPFGDALFLGLAFFAYFLARDSYIGVWRRPLLIIGAALAMQSAADFMFLVQARHGTWATGGINDFMYFVGYATLTYGLSYLGMVREDTRMVVGADGETKQFFTI